MNTPLATWVKARSRHGVKAESWVKAAWVIFYGMASRLLAWLLIMVDAVVEYSYT